MTCRCESQAQQVYFGINTKGCQKASGGEKQPNNFVNLVSIFMLIEED